MTDWLEPEFDKYRHWIDIERGKDRSWEAVRQGKPGRPLDDWLLGLVELLDFPSLGSSPGEREAAWNEIVAGKRKWEEEAARNGRVAVVVGPDAADRDVTVPVDRHSSWQMYRHHLLEGNWRQDAVDAIEASSLRILRRLKWSTDQPDGAVKGMVVGHVQSGKTASMAGLISMAMDWGWNLIVVLTGTIENLRRQTHERLLEDLNHGGNLSLRPINHPSLASPQGDRAQHLHFGANSRERYLVVSLKNVARLEGLKAWMERDSASLEQMRVLIIDDEADQAGIDTNLREPGVRENIEALIEERRRINQLIVRLTRVNAKCVNYVAYTATPYANFLNEAWPESLYPRNFIIALAQSPEHFGTKQIFGIEETEDRLGLGIVREIPVKDIAAGGEGDGATISDLHAGNSLELPESLREAVSWFLCCVAAIRVYGDIKKPVSMLVHTSMRQTHHATVAGAIQKWLREGGDSAHIQRCRSVWETRMADLSIEAFGSRFESYGRLHELRDYPAFSAIEPHIRDLLSIVTHIKMEISGLEPEPRYHSGIHVCVDNCANNGVNDEGEHLRLLYPTKEIGAQIGVATAFLVIGGSTLSRGLTIENLVSTYFLRGGAQLDALMQMGRWFGYRRGYELLPRIWMSDDTKRKFVYMAGVEQDLREELALFMDGGRDPSEYGPRIKTHPAASWLRPTAKNRMQEIQGARFDYSGINKQLTIFHAHSREVDTDLRNENIRSAEDFIYGLGAPSASTDSAVIWRRVAFESVKRFLTSQQFHGRAQFFREIRSFVEWFAENSQNYDDWNVVVAGTQASRTTRPEQLWTLPDGSKVGKVARTRLVSESDEDSVSIGVLRDPKDLVADVDSAPALGSKPSNRAITRERRTAGLASTPQLLVYRIDRESRVTTEDGEARADLGLPQDLIGVSIWMPGETRGRQHTFATHVMVKIPRELDTDADDPNRPAVTGG